MFAATTKYIEKTGRNRQQPSAVFNPRSFHRCTGGAKGFFGSDLFSGETTCREGYWGVKFFWLSSPFHAACGKERISPGQAIYKNHNGFVLKI